jgi:hypothetical protein
LGLGLGRDRVDFGRIEEVDAAVHGIVHLGVAFGLAVLFAEGHGAERQCRHAQLAVAQLSVFHGRSL